MWAIAAKWNIADVWAIAWQHNLEQRFECNEIYTKVDSVLVSINPFQPLPLYTPDILDRYSDMIVCVVFPQLVLNTLPDKH